MNSEQNDLGAQSDRGQRTNESNPLEADENGQRFPEDSASAPIHSTAGADCEDARPTKDFTEDMRSGGGEPGGLRFGEAGHNSAASISSRPAGGVQSSRPAGAERELRPSISDQAAVPGAAREDARPTNGRAVAVSDADIRTATLRLNAIQAFAALRASGLKRKAAARKVGHPVMTLYWWQKAFDAQGFDGLLPQNKKSGRKPTYAFTRQQAADVRALVLQTNRNETSGSVPEAVRAAMKRGLLDPEMTSLLKMRFDAGQHPLTPAMREQVRVSETATIAHRSPRNAWLQFVQSPGSLMLTRDEVTGEEREIEPAEKWTLDDGTINFVCCVPFNLPGNKCSERHGVMVGRFQFLLLVDHRSYFIPGFSYTARPRSSYRAEDLTATMHNAFAEHGRPRAMVLEHGVSASNLVTDTLGMLGVRIERAASPHQKVVEFVFNCLWTKLSLMPGQVGRFMGEEEEINALLVSCRSGATDPRKHFPLLPAVLKALHEAIHEWNEHLVKSAQYGRWVPHELWDRFKGKNLRRLEPEQSWMFSPMITQPLTVRGYKVRKSVCLMDGYSEVFDFSAEFMGDFNGAQVKLYFNPFAPECLATVVLAQNFQGKKAGTVLGIAEQINRMTRFRRRAFGYGEDPDIGLDATRRNAQALRRSVVAIRSDGSAGAQMHEARNGVGDSERVTNDARLAGTLAPPPGETPMQRARKRAAGVSEDEFEQQAARLARDECRAARAQTMIVANDD